MNKGPAEAAHTEIPASPSDMSPGSPVNFSGLKSHMSDTETEAKRGGKEWPMAAKEPTVKLGPKSLIPFLQKYQNPKDQRNLQGRTTGVLEVAHLSSMV